MNRFFALFTIFIFFLYQNTSRAQDDLLEMIQSEEADPSENVIATFKAIKVINAQTNETVKKNVLDVRITHRFGNIGEQAGGGFHTFWGLDNASNIRMSADYGITDKLQIGYGRSKMRGHFDLSGKYKLLEQKANNKIPLSVTLFVSSAFASERDPAGRYKNWQHRFSYVYQAIMARKFGEKFSLAVLPSYVHRNLVDNRINPSNQAAETNGFFSAGVAGRIKLTHRTVFVADYFYNFSPYRIDNPDIAFFNPLSVGLEIETGGHVFHINLSNSGGIIENDFVPDTRDSWLKGAYKLGFNISRVFSF